MCIYDCIIFFLNQNSKHLNIGLSFLLLYRLSDSESKVLQEQAYEFVGLYYYTSEIQPFQSTGLWNIYQHAALLQDPTGVSEYSQGKTGANLSPISQANHQNEPLIPVLLFHQESALPTLPHRLLVLQYRPLKPKHLHNVLYQHTNIFFFSYKGTISPFPG